jgi:capsular polysaccharide biosynthesis protein
MPTDPMPLPELLALLVKEGKRRILLLTSIFGVVAIGALVIGLIMPKRWEASTLIVADARDIIKPLLEGRAVPTTIADQTPIVSQAMVSHRILREIVAFGGWPVKNFTPLQEDRLLNDVKLRIKIEGQTDTIRISYFDSNPQRAYRITNKLGEIFIRESMALKEKQSRDAFDFISRRVQEYAQKMAEAHENLLAHYRGGEGPRAAVVARAATATAADAAGEPPRRPRVSPQELAALRAEEAKLNAQLAHKRAASSTPVESRQAEEQYRARVLQLQAELDRLRVTYTEQHPDVLRVQRELKDAKEELGRAEQARADHDKAAAAALDDDSTRAAALRLEEVQQQIAAATGTPRRPSGLRAAATAKTTPDLEMQGVGLSGSPQTARERARVDGPGLRAPRTDVAGAGGGRSPRDRGQPPIDAHRAFGPPPRGARAAGAAGRAHQGGSSGP